MIFIKYKNLIAYKITPNTKRKCREEKSSLISLKRQKFYPEETLREISYSNQQISPCETYF